MLKLLRLLALLGLRETAATEDVDEPGEEETDAKVRDPSAKIRSLEDHVNRLHRRLDERDAKDRGA